MQFFNLTALEEPIFKPNQSFLYLFSLEDLKKSFHKVSKGEDRTRLNDVLVDFYQGPIPDVDKRLWDEVVEKELNGERLVTKFQLTKAFEKAQEVEACSIVSDQFPASNESNSWREYRDAAARHVRKAEGPRDLLLRPLTSSQEFGWTCSASDAFPTKVFAKKSCEETKYASYLVKSGVVQ